MFNQGTIYMDKNWNHKYAKDCACREYKLPGITHSTSPQICCV